ncbi:MAG: GTPase [Candidatus Hodarchaeota archaeon]
MYNKIILFGPPAAGKTSIRKFFFEAVPAEDLLKTSELPTIGLNYNRFGYVYRYPMQKRDDSPKKFPIKLVVVDTAGQEVERWLNESKEHVFTETDLIVYVFDVSEWLDSEKKEHIKDLFKRACGSILEKAPNAIVYVLGHKFDKIKEGRPVKEKLKKNIRAELFEYIYDALNVEMDFDVFLTSLEKNYSAETFYNMLDITTSLLGRPF